MKRVAGILCVFLMVVGLIYAQPSEEYRKFKNLYPGDERVFLNLEKTLVFYMEDDSLKVDYSTHEESIYLVENTHKFSERSVNHSGIMRLKNLDAYSLVPKKNKYIKNKVDEFSVNDFADMSIFSDDIRETIFQLPFLEKGSKSVVNVDYKINDPYFIPMLFLSPYTSINEATLNIVSHVDVDIDIIEINLSEEEYHYSEKIKGKEKIRTFTFHDLAKTNYESNSLNYRYFAKQVAVKVNSYKTSEGEQNVLRGLDDLHRWYCEFVAQSQENYSNFKNLSDSIVNGETKQIEKVKKLYEWVQRNVRYIAFEEGYKGFIPQKATEVCSNRYGDCKGMANLLHNLLQSQDIPSSLTWVGTRDLPYEYGELPSTVTDNHMITSLELNGKTFFMDPTHSYLPFGLPSPFIQGKQTMVNLDCEKYVIKDVPITPAHANRIVDSVDVYLEGNDLIGKGKTHIHGYTRMDLQEYVNLTNDQDLFEFSREFLLKGSNKFILDNVQVRNLENINKPLILEYDFHIHDYVISAGNELYLNINFHREEIPIKINKERKLPFQFEYANSYQYVISFDLGDEYQLETTLNSSERDEVNMYYLNQSRAEGNRILSNVIVTYDLIVLEKKDFKKYNSFNNQLRKEASEQIILTTK